MARLTNIPRYALVGPTASGKTDVIHELAGTFGAGVISADAMMVYREMDIGTAKPGTNERGTIPYAGIDLADPDQAFSAFNYLTSVEHEMTAKRQTEQWLIAGGTGLYVKCLLAGLEESDGPNAELRQEGEQVLAIQGFEALKKWCRNRIPGIDANLPAGDAENPRRWIRAVERGGSAVKEVSAFQVPGETKIAGLMWSRPELEKRIRHRVDAMYDRGLVDEVEMLRNKYDVLSPTAAKAIGYAEAGELLDGTITRSEAIERTNIRTRQYAKRQMTWFRNQFHTQWIELTPGDTIHEIARRVADCWKLHG